MSVKVQSPPKDVGGMPTLDKILKGGIKHDVEEDPMIVWDKGVFLNELLKQGLVLKTKGDGAIEDDLVAEKGLKKGTYKGTQMALTEIYSLIEEAHASHFDTQGFEPIIPRQRSLEQKKDIFKWSDPKVDGYPPHLAMLPADQEQHASGVGDVFNSTELKFVSDIAKVFSFIIPETIEHTGTPYAGPTLADCEKYNREHLSQKTDIMEGQNIGNLTDWYSDARFAQQHLSGVNPTTIEATPPEKLKAYVLEASKQKLDGMKKLLSEGKDLLIQDYSYFRDATGLTNDQVFQNIVPELVPEKVVPVKVGDPEYKMKPTGKAVVRAEDAEPHPEHRARAAREVQLMEDANLRKMLKMWEKRASLTRKNCGVKTPIDYRGALEKSVTIFNRRLRPDEKGDVDEKDDWPWRYAKTCAQTADWARHEVAVHLVDTHMVEEAIIVATNRTIPEEHLLYQILSPHWFRTLALNAAARETLVPFVIARLAGFGPSTDPTTSRAFRLVNWSYKNFNFQDKYIPNDLNKRGFKLDAQGDKYRNYPYAYCMSFLWGIIREFVKSVLATKYKSDKDIQKDSYISDWCKEIQTSGQLSSFPSITTIDQLIDAVTMCIHTASPQHTAVNYLQDYYYSFVPSKPPALCTPLPDNLQTLQSYKEKDLTAALPIGAESPKWKDWLLAAQLPELLSFKVENRYNLITYAKSLYNVNKNRTASENKEFNALAIKEAAARFYSQLKDCGLAFEYISAIQTEGNVEYKVLQPELTAVSILI